ncbi:MAG TPA: RNA polymerase sigma factor [Clostridiales bacterium]|nr:RNA polymerase sigma factor [Clostridiales bacterium]
MRGGEKVQKLPLFRTDKELTQIYCRHVDTVYRICFMYMKNAHDTEDMVQNTFIRLIKDGTRFESAEHEKAWLIRTATNLCIDHFRSPWARTAYLEDIGQPAETFSFEIDYTIEKVKKLPPKYRTAIYLYYYEGYSTPEIAKILGKNESTVRNYLHKGRKLLKMEMEDDSL